MAKSKYKPKGVWGKRVAWHCQQCGLARQVRPSEAKLKYCSKQCYAEAKMQDRATFVCGYCGQEFWRAQRGRDARDYCSKSCAGKGMRKHSAHVDAWVAHNAQIARRVEIEASALRSIAMRVASLTRKCAHCGDTFIKPRPYARYCSSECVDGHKLKSLMEYRASESYAASKRKAKAKRRAVSRAVDADHIDPIAVFERDRWRCHICGRKTLRSKRGTPHPLAPELEHIVALADGGQHTWGNVACSCRECNRKKGAQSFGQLALGIPA